jgi:hypothetical protein
VSCCRIAGLPSSSPSFRNFRNSRFVQTCRPRANHCPNCLTSHSNHLC